MTHLKINHKRFEASLRSIGGGDKEVSDFWLGFCKAKSRSLASPSSSATIRMMDYLRELHSNSIVNLKDFEPVFPLLKAGSESVSTIFENEHTEVVTVNLTKMQQSLCWKEGGADDERLWVMLIEQHIGVRAYRRCEVLSI